MNDADDPIRLSDTRSQAPSELSALFREAPLELPSAERLEAMRLRLPDAPSPVPKAGSLLKRPALSKAAIGALALGIAGVAAIWVAQRSAEPVPVPAPARSASKPEASSEPTRAPEPIGPVVTPPASVPEGTPSKPGANQRPGVASKRTDEAALLERARRALTSDPELSLALIRRHRTEFPNGVLRQEREVIGIEALRRLGRSDEASRKAKDFQDDFPDSPHGRAVERGQSK